MPYPNWLKFGRKNNEDIHVDKVRQETIDPGEMAAGSPSAAAKKLAKILDQQKAAAKILVIGNGAFSANLSDYAIRMGQRLDCEIVALNVLDKRCPAYSTSDEKKKAHFMKRTELSVGRFADKAACCAVKFQQLTKFGLVEKAIAQAIEEISGIRFVLSEPDDMYEEEDSGRVQLPVIDTPGSNL